MHLLVAITAAIAVYTTGIHVVAKVFYQFCWHIKMTANPPSPVPIGTVVNVTITDIELDCDECPYNQACNGQGGNVSLALNGTLGAELTIGLLGPAWALDLSGGPQKATASFIKSTLDDRARTVDGDAWVLVQIGDVGPTVVSVDMIRSLDWYFAEYAFEPNTIGITGLLGPTPPPPTPPPPSFPDVAKLLLYPHKAYRHVHDPVTLTVKALDANGLPVANASVTFAAFGDCEPIADTAVKTTNAEGLYSGVWSSSKPGAVAVVAASVNAQGVVVLSDPSHIIFFEDHGYVEDREPKYYGHKHYKHAETTER